MFDDYRALFGENSSYRVLLRIQNFGSISLIRIDPADVRENAFDETVDRSNKIMIHNARVEIHDGRWEN